MMKNLISMIVLVLLLSNCKKDEPPRSSSGNNTVATPTQMEVTISFDGQELHYDFGNLGTSLQFFNDVNLYETDTFALYIGTSFFDFDPNAEITYGLISLPNGAVSINEYESNPSQAFLNYFSGSMPITQPSNARITFQTPEATFISEDNSFSGNWNISHAIESNEFPVTVRSQGDLDFQIMNTTTAEIMDAHIHYVMRFQELN
jgi:hypothetical protein